MIARNLCSMRRSGELSITYKLAYYLAEPTPTLPPLIAVERTSGLTYDGSSGLPMTLLQDGTESVSNSIWFPIIQQNAVWQVSRCSGPD